MNGQTTIRVCHSIFLADKFNTALQRERSGQLPLHCYSTIKGNKLHSAAGKHPAITAKDAAERGENQANFIGFLSLRCYLAICCFLALIVAFRSAKVARLWLRPKAALRASAASAVPYCLLWCCVCFALCCCGCWTSSGPQVVVYSALDREFSEPILKSFQQQTGVKVLANYDIESTKTVGLVNRIIAESNRPRCDVFWNNEILHTLRLQQLGLLQPYEAQAASQFPRGYRPADGSWHGFAARARVLIVNTQVLADETQWPTSVQDLVDPRWKDQVAIAKPLFGTTASQAAVLFATWGDDRARDFFRKVRENAHVLSGNKQVAQSVADGLYAFGLTDTDDAIIEKEHAKPVAIVYPDQGSDGMGTLFIPNTVCLIKNGPNLDHGRQLIEYLLSAAVEQRLAEGQSAQFPVNPRVEVRSRVAPQHAIKWMPADFQAAASAWEEARQFLTTEF